MGSLGRLGRFWLTYDTGQHEVLESLPDPTVRIKEGLLDKKILGRNGVGRWEPRQALYTKHMLVLAKVGEDKVLDCVPLEEVDNVVFVCMQGQFERNKSVGDDLGDCDSDDADQSSDDWCVHAYTYTHTCVYAHTHMYIYICMCMCVCMYVCISTYTYTSMSMSMSMSMSISVSIYVCMCVCVCVCVCVGVWVCVCVYMNICTAYTSTRATCIHIHVLERPNAKHACTHLNPCTCTYIAQALFMHEHTQNTHIYT